MRELRVEVEQFERQVSALFPALKGRWSWHIERILTNHILIHLYTMVTEPGHVYPLVWSRHGSVSVWDLESWDKFIQLVEDEGLIIPDNLQDILDIFCFFQPHRRILQSLADIKFVCMEKSALLSEYAKRVIPPMCSVCEGQQQARFWTIDYGFGNLEEWLLVQEGMRLRVQSWIREEGFVLTLLGP